MRHSLIALSLLGVATFSLPTLAQTAMTEGQVRRPDMANAKITIRDGEIKNLGMPPMSMVFVAKPACLLNGIKVGDKILFRAAEENSQYVVTQLKNLWSVKGAQASYLAIRASNSGSGFLV